MLSELGEHPKDNIHTEENKPVDLLAKNHNS